MGVVNAGMTVDTKEETMSMNFVKPTRRQFLAGTAALGAASFTGMRRHSPMSTGRNMPARRSKSTSSRARAARCCRSIEKEFEELTGIKVNSEQTPEQQQRQKAVIELNSGKPELRCRPHQLSRAEAPVRKGRLARRPDRVPEGSEPDRPVADGERFLPGRSCFRQGQEGPLRSLPFSVDYWIVYWNKDLFAKKGLDYPQTFEEMVQAAEALTDPDAGTYGFVARGLKNANVPVWTSLMLGYGIDPVDADGNLQTDSPEAIEAAKLYQRLMTKSAPPGVAGSTGRNASRPSCRARSACGSTVSASRRRSKIRKSRASSARSVMASCRRARRRRLLRRLRRRHRRHRRQQEEGSRLSLLPVGHFQGDGCASAAGRRRRSVPQLDPGRCRRSAKA